MVECLILNQDVAGSSPAGGTKKDLTKKIDGVSYISVRNDWETSMSTYKDCSGLEKVAEKDLDCICKGNWRLLVREEKERFNRKFKGTDGEIYRFFGLVYAANDYYYGMMRVKDSKAELLTCVGSIETNGFEEIKGESSDEQNV